MRDRLSKRSHEAILRLVAQLYYERGLTQQDIAELTGFSISKVSRLHREARERGIVTITVESDDRDLDALADELGRALRLDVHVTAGLPGPPVNSVRLCGAAAAPYIASLLPETGVVGWTSGLTVEALVSALPELVKPHLVHVPLVGGWDPQNPYLDPNALVRTLADRLGGAASVLPAPAVLDSYATKAALLADSSFASTTRLWSEVKLAVIGVSGPAAANPGYGTTADRIAPDLRQELIDLGVVGDVVGHYFDIDGNIIEHETTDRTVSMPLDQIRSVPRVVAVVAGAHKVPTIMGLARTRVVHTIVTDSISAQSVLAELRKSGDRRSDQLDAASVRHETV